MVETATLLPPEGSSIGTAVVKYGAETLHEGGAVEQARVHSHGVVRSDVLKDFKQFLLRGNVVDLAVGIVIGVAFGAVVTALVADVITPIIAAVFGSHDFSTLTFTIHKSRFLYGDVINKLIAFITIAAAVFFLVVRPVNSLMARKRTEPPVDETTRKCPECLSEIPAEARRCAFCTAEVAS